MSSPLQQLPAWDMTAHEFFLSGSAHRLVNATPYHILTSVELPALYRSVRFLFIWLDSRDKKVFGVSDWLTRSRLRDGCRKAVRAGFMSEWKWTTWYVRSLYSCPAWPHRCILYLFLYRINTAGSAIVTDIQNRQTDLFCLNQLGA